MRTPASIFLMFLPLLAQSPTKTLQTNIQSTLDAISEDRIAATMKKLASFGTRDSNSATDDPNRGIGAARRWIYEEFQSYSPRLQVRYDSHPTPKSGRIVKDTDLVNVVAVLPGSDPAAPMVAAGAHYDSWSTTSALDAPGVDDNASGVAAVMELARVLSAHEFPKTLVFIAFAGEEQGLLGARGFARQLKADKQPFEALLNNDTIGSIRSGNGFLSTHAVRVFSDEPMDSGSRSLARYIREVGERYVSEMRVDLIFRRDRFGRGGDHTAFHGEGFAAVRFTTPAENLTVQHTPDDTFEHSSSALTARVARVNAAVLASLGLAPAPPALLPIARGTSRYDAVLRWRPSPGDNVTGYSVLIRSTLSPFWEKEISVGNVTEFAMKNVSIDDIVIGVRAVSASGAESLVSVYQAAPFRIPER